MINFKYISKAGSKSVIDLGLADGEKKFFSIYYIGCLLLIYSGFENAIKLARGFP